MSAATGADIHCMCAAHLNSPQRLLRLTQMLSSWRQQTQCIPALSISLSHNLDATYHDAIDRLEQQYNRDGKLSIAHQLSPTRQGHHYRYLVHANTMLTEDAWIMYTDDDDIWSPMRTYTLATTLAQQPDADAVLIPSHVRHAGHIPDLDRRVCLHAATALVRTATTTKRKNDHHQLPQGGIHQTPQTQASQANATMDVSTADDVEVCLAENTLCRSHALALGAGCYWAYAVRRHVVAAFIHVSRIFPLRLLGLLPGGRWDFSRGGVVACEAFGWPHTTTHAQKASDDLLAHRAWDLAFVRYIHTACRLHIAPPCSDWMYYWRVDTAAAHDPPPHAARRRRQLLGLLEAYCAITREQAMEWQALEAAGAAWGVPMDHLAQEELRVLWHEAQDDLAVLLNGPRGDP